MTIRKTKVGILTFSDGRKYIHETLVAVNQKYQDRLAAALEATGEVEAIPGREIIWTAEGARREAQHLREMGAEMTVFNFAIWAFPNLAAIATTFAPGPYLLFSNLHPSEPGMVAMLACAGTMDQLGLTYRRVWGDIQEPDTLQKVMEYIRAAGALAHLKGETYGLFGGRPLGMYTAVANQDQWRSLFGVDVEHVEQYDIVRASEKVSEARVDAGLAWLEKYVKDIRYDGKVLTTEKLKKQIRSYHAVRQIMADRDLDFVGFKSHGDLTDYFVTMDLAEAFLNDPYDWEGPHEPIVAATEADMDGALTMELLKHISGGQTNLFADIRHYDAEDNVWYFANSGTHATYFAARSKDPAENLRKVSFYPEIPDYPAGGGSVQFFAGPGPMTLARLARKKGQYWLAVVPANFVEFSQEKMEAKAHTTDIEWPHAFARLEVSADTFLASYPCNHIHGISGDWVNELCAAAEILGIEARVYR
ncbi:L-fucose isomerase [Longilinea arvoryzae]|uniref:FucIase n=1 Tax=Longilinea arvoryzae TaxID=360412 RepID=A0A0S7BG90_9CHLR|nr:L-fucose/L-arabinose isomerase family protein [Longilinea arvoryzae]GAP13144.1 L-fucose isomerase [Longilinea arvoryzae]